MEIIDLSGQQLADLFPNSGTQNTGMNSKPSFGLGDFSTDLFNQTTINETTVVETTIDPNMGETTADPTVTDTTTIDANILDPQSKPGRKPKYSFEDTSGYFADRIKNGKFVAIKEEDEQGNEVDFIPKTPEEFDEVIDLQISYQIEQKQKELEQKWYEQKSPAWRAVAKFADLVSDPSEIVPFIQGVNTIQKVANLDENEIADAEKIVRIRMSQAGDPEDLIDDQIEALKSTNRLTQAAQKYKPLLIQEEQRSLAEMQRQKEEETRYYQQMMMNIRQNTIKTLDSLTFGKAKLKDQDKAQVYELIGEPTKESGYQIYSKIDSLFSEGKFETLAKVALLLSNEDALINYIQQQAAESTAAGLQRKLRVAQQATSTSSTQNTGADEPNNSINRNRYTSKFGR